MKLVEVVILVGSQCISPLQHTANETVAGKVSCAVLIHQDTEKNLLMATPAAAVSHPRVRLALGLPVDAGATAPEPDAPFEGLEPNPKRKLVSGQGGMALSLEAEGKQAMTPAAPEQPGVTVIHVQRPSDEELRPAETATTVQVSQEPPQPEAAPPETGDGASESAMVGDGVAVDETPDMPDQGEPSAAEAPAKPAKKATRTASASGSAKKRAGKRSDKCGTRRVANWYTNAQGRRKYRCVLPGKAKLY
ncbi:MAG: hypothetical protein KDK89_05220 [Alphaproteobacteria bacterium]|nr:hypothetical protein [Alphaproteobacteria bacterium]